MPRTDDFDADVRLMQTVDRVLRQNSGDDPDPPWPDEPFAGELP